MYAEMNGVIMAEIDQKKGEVKPNNGKGDEKKNDNGMTF
jgi:hypothetical protein